MSSISVANAPCSWGVLEFELEGETQTAEEVLQEMSETGYIGTEFGDWGFLPTEPDDLRALLGKYELSLLGAFVPVALSEANTHRSGIEMALKVARLLSAVNPKALIILADDNGRIPERTQWAGRIEAQHGLSADGWKTFSKGAESIAMMVLAETGLRTVFHHHCAGYVETPQ